MKDVPSYGDLLERIRFEPEAGRIWLDEQRMLLLHTATFGALRHELIESLGTRHAQAVIARMGYASGSTDATLARKIRHDASVEDAFMVGPQLHSLEGVVNVEKVKLEMDFSSGHFYGEFLWHNSYEAEESLRLYGVSSEPVCWSQIGYACGYTSHFFNKPIVYKEVECIGKGDAHCRIIGRPLDEWDDADRLRKVFDRENIAETIYSLKDEISNLRTAMTGVLGREDIVANSPRMRECLEHVHRAGGVDVTVLFLGETGVGKEVFANLLHRLSPRREAPFVAVNCAALPKELIEAELFGVEKGAYTGAESSRPGRFERAHGGTLFLDEVGEMPMESQAKLLRVLQTGELDRIGDVATRKVDVRLVAATNQNLEQLVSEGRFRADLYYRLSVFPIQIAPLRERIDDLPELIERFIKRYNVKYGRRVKGVTDKVMSCFRSYGWPGNVRELENVIERGIILTGDDQFIDTDKLYANMAVSSDPSDCFAVSGGGGLCRDEASKLDGIVECMLEHGMSLDDLEKSIIKTALAHAGGNVSAAARLIGMTAPQFRYRLKKFDAS